MSKFIVKPFHGSIVSGRRARIISELLESLLPEGHGLRVLDVGCGTGVVTNLLKKRRPDIEVTGVDVLVRADAVIPVTEFDGRTLPFEDKSFDCVTLIDVLHHVDPNEQERLFTECLRVAQQVLIKDHVCDGKFDETILRFMDWVGNKAHKVHLPYKYLSSQEWVQLYNKTGVRPEKNITTLHLYPQPFSLLFDRKLHFAASLKKGNA